MGCARLKQKAISNNELRKKKFDAEISNSVKNSYVYEGIPSTRYDIGKPEYGRTRSDIIGVDIEQYLMCYLEELEGRTAVLNFASYKNPGGKYMDGMMAQEEALCHCSTLYEVISQFPSYYEWNSQHKNKGMYMDRMIYSPAILALDFNNNVVGEFDVITCAAPNMSVGLRYGSFTVSQCRTQLYARAEFIMRMAAYRKVRNLILGAWGCGVFKNDPEFVAKTFFELQKKYDGYFKNVNYVISKDESYYAFLRAGAGK